MEDKETLITKYEKYNHISLREMIRSDIKRWGSAANAITKLGFYSSMMYIVAQTMVLQTAG